jgi:hypothetical protein
MRSPQPLQKISDESWSNGRIAIRESDSEDKRFARQCQPQGNGRSHYVSYEPNWEALSLSHISFGYPFGGLWMVEDFGVLRFRLGQTTSLQVVQGAPL